ncbi:hypothetical protein SDRG_16448 [Saprolegnia diclina VS20]|uniref:F-box domain-containing protein n=1 Tax=Saprolegnia diclina (strain VS20) TaxID=1156394 RepID=T0PXF2_SAPDV|nr:hypothetical protein SDRG_16448 [Saprolegnia diclina VS20]EQC25710.1 hypothetical protein SDRG_16448 [Saprolegnia diclina VS20]|eukprot:XP_008620880.1 hypothetical protein SDRG_16448 [Saprolegnia diclina VS20]
MSLAVVLALPDLVEAIIGFVPCPYAAHAFLQLLPVDGLSSGLQSYLALARHLPPSQLWPRMQASSLARANLTALAYASLPEIGVLDIDTWRSPLLPWLCTYPTLPFAVSAPASMQSAASWHGHRLLACALTLQSFDTIDQFESVASWLRAAPALQHLQLRHEADVTNADGLTCLLAAVATSRIVELDVANDTDDHFSEALYTWLGTWLRNSVRPRALRLTALHVPDAEMVSKLVSALRACSTLRELSLAFMDDVATALFQAPLPRTLRRLSLNISRIRTGDDFVQAIRGSHLTHVALVNRTRQLGPTYDKTMAKVLYGLGTLPRVRSIELTYISMGARSKAALAAALVAIAPTLETLSLTCFGSTPHYLPGWLAPVLLQCTALHRLALRNVYWSAADVCDWPLSPSLRFVCVRGSKLECDGQALASKVELCCLDDVVACHLGDPDRSVHGVHGDGGGHYDCL